MLAERLYQAAVGALHDGDWDRAARHLLALTAKAPGYRRVTGVLATLERTQPDAYWRAAFAFALTREAWDHAAIALDKLEKLDPDAPDLDQMRGQLRGDLPPLFPLLTDTPNGEALNDLAFDDAMDLDEMLNIGAEWDDLPPSAAEQAKPLLASMPPVDEFDTNEFADMAYPASALKAEALPAADAVDARDDWWRPEVEQDDQSLLATLPPTDFDTNEFEAMGYPASALSVDESTLDDAALEELWPSAAEQGQEPLSSLSPVGDFESEIDPPSAPGSHNGTERHGPEDGPVDKRPDADKPGGPKVASFVPVTGSARGKSGPIYDALRKPRALKSAFMLNEEDAPVPQTMAQPAPPEIAPQIGLGPLPENMKTVASLLEADVEQEYPPESITRPSLAELGVLETWNGGELQPFWLPDGDESDQPQETIPSHAADTEHMPPVEIPIPAPLRERFNQFLIALSAVLITAILGTALILGTQESAALATAEASAIDEANAALPEDVPALIVAIDAQLARLDTFDDAGDELRRLDEVVPALAEDDAALQTTLQEWIGIGESTLDAAADMLAECGDEGDAKACNDAQAAYRRLEQDLTGAREAVCELVDCPTEP